MHVSIWSKTNASVCVTDVDVLLLHVAFDTD